MKKAQESLLKALNSLKKYTVILVVVIFGAMYGLLINTSSQFAKQEPTQVEIDEKFQGASRPKIDEAAARKLTELQAQNIEIQTLFNEARNNPFSE